MDFDFLLEEKEVLAEVREFIQSEVSPELHAETQQLGRIYGGEEGRAFTKKFAAHGWLVPNWSRE